MTKVAPSRPDMTALAPPPALLLTNRHASPSRTSTNHSSPADEDALQTDRLLLAKERQADREKTQDLSALLRDKERRVQQQLERCAGERGRRMEEQRRKEQQRRAAAEERRRQQQEAEKVRGHSTLSQRTT
ncbi:hypothetical protein LDENG_00069830 [Lucifuga dentata]|nr:hypothetical protein LDENG_00069830 [Lucifuga dentata]